MLDVGEALLISEPKIQFAVPVNMARYREYLKTHNTLDYELPSSLNLAEMYACLKK